MKKSNVILLSTLLVAVVVIAGVVLNLNGDNEKGSVPKASDKKIVQVAESSGVKAAQQLNEIKDDQKFKDGVRDVLDNYYENDKGRDISKFSNTIDSRANEIVNNYKDAAAERDNSKNLSYVAGQVCVAVDKNMSEKELIELAEDYRGTLDDVIELDDEENLAIINISLEYTVDKASEVYEDANENVEYAEPNVYYQIPESSNTDKLVEKITSKDLEKSQTSKSTESTTASANIATNDTYYNYQEYLAYMNTTGAWTTQTSVPTKKISVAVIDSGCAMKHPDLQTTVSKSLSVRILNGKYTKLTKLKTPDPVGHGTHVCGIIGATGNNGKGVTGVATGGTNSRVNVIAIGVGNKNGTIRVADAIRAINYAKKKKVKAINMSFVSYDYKSSQAKSLAKAIKSAYSKKIFCVAAAGNNNTSIKANPSDNAYATSVTATGYTYNSQYNIGIANYYLKATYSNFGSAKDIAAPGSGIASTYTSIQYKRLDGTSMAAPVITGTVAMMYSVNPNMSVKTARNYLYKTARDLGTAGKDKYYGYGLVNAGAAVFKTTRPSVTVKTIGYSGNGATARISWNAIKGSGTTTYDVYRKDGSGSYAKVRSGLTISYMDDSYLAFKNKYTYKVIANNNGTTSQYSVERAVTPRIGTTTLSSLPVSDTTATLTWSACNGATRYYIYRSTSPSGPWDNSTLIGNSSGTSYVSGGLTTGQNYWYRVSAVRLSGNTELDRTWSAVQIRPVVGATTLTQLNSSKTKISVYWKAVDGATAYRIYRYSGKSYSLVKTISNGTKTAGTDMKWTNSNLKKNTKYYYKIVVTKNTNTATNTITGISKTSNTKSIKTKK